MSQVVIGDILPYTQATSTAGQTVYGTNWTANYASDVVVYYTPAGSPPDDATQLLPYPADYSVAFIGGSQQVQVTLVTPANLGDIVTITRQTPADRLNLYTNTNFLPTMLNNDFGILTLVDQQAQLVNQLIGPRYNYSAIITDVIDTILPILGANQFWAKNGNNTAIEALDITSIISGGTVTEIDTGVGLTGGPITNAGTISFAAIAANSFWANTTGGSAVPTVTSLAAFLLSANNLSDLTDDAAARANLGLQIGVNVQAYSAALASIAGLTTVSNNLIYTTASNTYAALAPVNNRTLVTNGSGAISWSDTLPQAVQTNIQYLGIQNQALNMGGFQIKDGADPTQPSDFATKNYVDLNALSGTAVYAASAATLGTVTQSGSGVGATLTNAGVQATFALDGVNPPQGSNVLIKNTSTGATAANEGIYTVTNAGSNSTNWVLTRATTYDTPTEINQTGLIIVQNGSTLAGTAWYNAVTIVTVDVTNFSYSEFGNIVFPVSLAHGGTNANLTASNGGIFYSTSTAGAILAGTSTANQMLMSGASTTPAWSTNTWPATDTKGDILYASAANTISGLGIGSTGNILTIAAGLPAWTTTTYPSTNAINTIMYASSANVLGVIAAANSSVLISSSGGVPSMSTTLPAGLTIPGYAASGANADITSMSDLTGYLSAPLGIKDSGGNILLAFTYTASAVNYVGYLNNTTGSPPAITAQGADTNIGLQLNGKGTGGVIAFGTGTNDNAVARQVGEYISSSVLVGSAVSCANATTTNITLIALTAGDWDVSASLITNPAAGTVTTGVNAGIGLTSATFGTLGAENNFSYIVPNAAGSTIAALNVGRMRISLSTTTNIYLIANISFSVSTMTAYGFIGARRVR